MIDQIVSEHSLRYLAAELQWAQIKAAQLAGNLALAQARVAELEAAAAKNAKKKRT